MERCRWEGQNFQPLKEVQRLEEEEAEEGEEEGRVGGEAEGGGGEAGGGGGEAGGGGEEAGGGGEEEEFSRKIFEKQSNIESNEYLSSGRRVVAYRHDEDDSRFS